MPKALRRNYNFSDGEIIELADSLIVVAVRDATELAGYGYDVTDREALQTLRDEFADIATDEFYSGEMQIATADKNDKMAAMRKVAEDVVKRAKIKWDNSSPYVRQFGFEGYAAKKETDKLQVCRLVLKAGTTRLDDLEGVGLTQAILDDLRAKTNAADEAVTTKRTKISERDVKTHERIKTGNELYAAMRKLADIGKHVWESENEAKYNDYVLYSSGQQQGEIITGTPAAESIHVPAVNFDSESNSIEFENNGSVALQIYFADDPETEPGTTAATVAPGDTWQGTAGDIGYSLTNFRFLIKNNETAAGSFLMVVND